MNKDTDIKILLDEYNDLKNNTKIFNEYEEIKNQVIGKIVKLTNIDFDKCKEILENEPEIILGLIKNIDNDLIDKYLDKLKKYNSHVDKCIMIRTKLIMIIRQISGYSFDRCTYFYKYDEEMMIKILKYIDKLEKK